MRVERPTSVRVYSFDHATADDSLAFSLSLFSQRYAEARYVHRRVSRLCATASGVRKVKRVIKRRERFAEVLAKSRRQLEQEHEIHRRPAAYDTLRHDGVLNFISVPRRAPPGGSYY